MKPFTFILLLMGSHAFCATKGYDLKLDLSLDGKHVASPRVLVKDGDVATVNQKSANQETFVEVVATDAFVDNKRGILMKFAVGTIGKNGERTMVYRPEVFARENETTQVSLGDKPGAEGLSLSVVAKHKSLE